MIEQFVEKNKFGGRSWRIMFDKAYPIYLHETNQHNLLVEFKEFKWLYFKTIFMFTSNKSVRDTIVDALDRVEEHFSTKKIETWTTEQRNQFQMRTFDELKYSELSKLP